MDHGKICVFNSGVWWCILNLHHGVLQLEVNKNILFLTAALSNLMAMTIMQNYNETFQLSCVLQ